MKEQGLREVNKNMAQISIMAHALNWVDERPDKDGCPDVSIDVQL